MRALLVVFSVVLTGCAEVGSVLVDDEAPVVTIVGGTAATGTGSSWRVFYFVDRRTRLCAMEIGVIGGVVPCCDVWRLKEARPHLRWLSAEKCAEKPIAAEQKERAPSPEPATSRELLRSPPPPRRA